MASGKNDDSIVKKASKKTFCVLCSFFKKKEGQTLSFIKNNRTKVLLDFFRGHSAIIVVIIVTFLVSAGNAISGSENGGFLFDALREEASNSEIIQRRVKNHSATKENLTVVPLNFANEKEAEEEDVVEFALKDANLNQNQMQYQVLTAGEPDAKEFIEQGSDVAVYEVQSGDTVASIAKDFGVTQNTILWANDIDDPNLIMPGDKIFVLPVTGVNHVIKEGDNIDKIAEKYEADKEKIIAFNNLPADGAIKVGDELIIPDGEIEEVRPTTPAGILDERDYYSSSVADGSNTREPSLIDRNPKGGHVFPYGYCTWYVAQNKYVPWGGNAGTWLYHAKAYGAKTGKTPKKGAIIVTSESWYGHVGIVTKVSGSKVTIKEMNYAGWGKVSSRTISAKSRVIKGYIY